MQSHQHSEKDNLVRRRQPAEEAQGFDTPALAGADVARLPAGRGSGGLRQQAVLQAQRRLGNHAVQRTVIPPNPFVDQQPASDSGGSSSAPTAITDGAATVSTAGGVVNIDAPMITLNAAMVNAAGVLRAPTLVADQVVAASYTPGAGNIW